MRVRRDPGDCPICGAAHCSCGGSPIIAIPQLPQRDAAAAAPEGQPPDLAVVVAPAPAPPESFTTATYRGKQKKP